MEIISYKQYMIHVLRRPYRRTMSLSLKINQPIQVKVGLRTSTDEIFDFIQEREDWLNKHVANFAKISEKFPKKKFKAGEVFPFLGEDVRLEIEHRRQNRVSLLKQDSKLILFAPQRFKDEEIFFKVLQKFYKINALKYLTERAEIHSQKMNLHYSQLRFKNQSSRWGSCSSKKIVNLNWRLIGAPLLVIDYVIIHELAHLKHLDHSANFWNLVERHSPNYRQAEKWLKDNSMALDFLKNGLGR